MYVIKIYYSLQFFHQLLENSEIYTDSRYVYV